MILDDQDICDLFVLHLPWSFKVCANIWRNNKFR